MFPSAVYDEPIHDEPIHKEQCRFLGVKPYLHYNLPVSYTHLDVYKRQVLAVSVAISTLMVRIQLMAVRFLMRKALSLLTKT